MANGSFKIKKSANLDPQTGSVVSSAGDIAYNNSTNKLELYNGAVDPMVQEAKASTLTNKTLSVGSNTFSGFSNFAVLTSDGSGNETTGIVPGTSGNVLTSNGTNWTSAAVPTANNSYLLQNLGLNVSQSAGTMTIALKQADGTTDPASGSGSVVIGFRGTTNSNGDYSLQSVISSLSLSLSGAINLGNSDGTVRPIYVYAVNNAGTITLGASLNIFDTTVLQSTFAANNNTALYQPVGLTNKPVRLIGSFTAANSGGAWQNPTSVSLVGPSAITSNQNVAAKFNRTTSFLNGAGNTNPILYDAVDYDTHQAYNSGSGTYTIPVSGFYQISQQSRWSPSGSFSSGNQQNVDVFVNGSDTITIGGNTSNATASTDVWLSGSGCLKLQAGDAITIQIFQTGVNATSSTGSQTWASIVRVGS